MKKILFIIAFISGFMMTSCYDEDAIKADIGENVFALKDSNDPVDHYIYEYSKKYSSIIRYEYTDEQYKWNMGSNLRIEAERIDGKLKLDQLNFLKYVFLEVYPEDFRKKYFPVNIFVAKSMPDWDMWLGDVDLAATVTIGNICLGRVIDDVTTYSDEGKATIKGEANAVFWTKYLISKGKFEVNKAFYKVSEAYYGRNTQYPTGEEEEPVENIKMEDYGFLRLDEWYGSYQFTQSEPDLFEYFKYIFSHTKEEREALCAQYPLVEKKMNIILNGIKSKFNLDL